MDATRLDPDQLVLLHVLARQAHAPLKVPYLKLWVGMMLRALVVLTMPAVPKRFRLCEDRVIAEQLATHLCTP